MLTARIQFLHILVEEVTTEKNHDLLKELILDNSNEGDIVFDPCSGSGSHLLVANENSRKWIGTELNEEYFNIARDRMK